MDLVEIKDIERCVAEVTARRCRVSKIDANKFLIDVPHDMWSEIHEKLKFVMLLGAVYAFIDTCR